MPFRSTWCHSRTSAGNVGFEVCSRTAALFVTRVKCSQRFGPHERGLQKDALVPWWCWKATLKTCSVHWRDGFTPAIIGVRANDLEQLMCDTFRVGVCERVDRGFLTRVEILRRKAAWNVEDFFWIYDPTRTLALADEFGFAGKKQHEQPKSILVAPGSKTMNKGSHDGADLLDERETHQWRSLIGTALNDGQDRPGTQYSTEESARFTSDPTRAVKCMLKRLCTHYSEASVHSWSFPYQEMQCEVKVDRGILGRGTGGTVDDGRLDLFWWLSAGDVFFDTADCGAVFCGE